MASDVGGLRSGAVGRRSAGSEAVPIDNLGAEPFAGQSERCAREKKQRPYLPPIRSVDDQLAAQSGLRAPSAADFGRNG
jgi:hypothetical protein